MLNRARAPSPESAAWAMRMAWCSGMDTSETSAPALASTSTAAMTRSRTATSASSKPSWSTPIRSGHPIGEPAKHVQAGGDVARRAGIVGVIPRGGLERRRRILDGPGHRTRVVDALV